MVRSARRALPLAALVIAGCTTTSTQRRANVLEYLYPQGTPALPPSDIRLDLPLRVGIAFAPTQSHESVFDETSKRDLLEQVAAAFRGTDGIQSVDVIPTTDLRPGGGFENLDQVAAMHGLEVMALVSYDQVQFDEARKSSITYWTIVGAYVIEGNRNETRTVLDASVFDIPSRALLFRASGSSSIKDSSTAVESSRKLRSASREGFQEAATDLIADLSVALEGFREQAKAGYVRGAGTPAVSFTGESGSGGSGAGALGALELAAAGLLLASGARALRKQR
jgi:rhombotail lipoprotein